MCEKGRHTPGMRVGWGSASSSAQKIEKKAPRGPACTYSVPLGPIKTRRCVRLRATLYFRSVATCDKVEPTVRGFSAGFSPSFIYMKNTAYWNELFKIH